MEWIRLFGELWMDGSLRNVVHWEDTRMDGRWVIGHFLVQGSLDSRMGAVLPGETGE